ncbi:MAG: hypothetical protein ACJ8FY_26195 [Gemmataceae bacterium]
MIELGGLYKIFQGGPDSYTSHALAAIHRRGVADRIEVNVDSTQFVVNNESPGLGIIA